MICTDCAVTRPGAERSLDEQGGRQLAPARVGEDRRETLLLLHGSAGSAALWREQERRFAPSYRIVAPDLIGYGESPHWPETKPLELADEVRHVQSLLPCCDRGMHVVGYSYGGAVALALAQANPVLIKTLTLIEPVFFSALRYAGEDVAYGQFQAVRDRFGATLGKGEHEHAMRDFIEFWTGPGSWDALGPAVRLSMTGQAAKIRLDWEASFALDPGVSLLSRLGPRTLLVRGERSPVPMVKLVDTLHALMPESRLRVVCGANHLLPLTHGASLTEALLAHLHRDAERALR